MGRPQKKYKRFSCNLSYDTLKRIHDHAQMTGMTMTNIIEFALNEYFRKHGDLSAENREISVQNII